MTSSDGSFCLPVCVFVFYMCIYREQCLSYFTWKGGTTYWGQCFPEFYTYLFVFVSLFLDGVCLYACMCVCMCVGTVLQLAFLYHALSLSGLVTSKPRSGVYSCERHRCFTYVFITKIIHQSFHKPRQLSLHVPRCVSSPLHVTVMLYRDVAQQTCTMLHIKVQQMFFKHETIFVSKMLFYLTIFLPSKVSAIPRTC